jgi:hypothetical protein
MKKPYDFFAEHKIRRPKNLCDAKRLFQRMLKSLRSCERRFIAAREAGEADSVLDAYVTHLAVYRGGIESRPARGAALRGAASWEEVIRAP